MQQRSGCLEMTILIAIIMALFIYLLGCTASRQPVKAGTSTYKVIGVEKVKEGSIVDLEGLNGRYILPCDTLKVGDIISVSWVNTIMKRGVFAPKTRR